MTKTVLVTPLCAPSSPGAGAGPACCQMCPSLHFSYCSVVTGGLLFSSTGRERLENRTLGSTFTLLGQNSSLKSVSDTLKRQQQDHGFLPFGQHHEGRESREFDQLTVPDTGTKFIDLPTKTDQREPKGPREARGQSLRSARPHSAPLQPHVHPFFSSWPEEEVEAAGSEVLSQDHAGS